MIRCTAARQTPAVCFSVTHCPRNRLDGAVTAVTVLGWSRDCCHCCIVSETSTGGPPMTASYRIGVCGSPQCPRSCGRTGAARQGRLQLCPMAHTLGGNAALHHARMPATDGCIRVIATMLGDLSIPRRADVRLTMWEAADMHTAVACAAEDVCAVDMDGYSER